MPAPGLYHLGRILVFPSKLEGLGLPLLEGLAAGMPAIVADAPPMNEFVRPGTNGVVVRVALRRVRQDGIAFPEAILDVRELALQMAELALDVEATVRLATGARRYAEAELRVDRLGDRLGAALRGLC